MAKNKPVTVPDGVVRARVICSGHFGQVNDVVALPAEEIAAGVASGELDSSADAVAYAESLG